MNNASLSTDAGAWDPKRHQVGIVHIGIGAFHRAHQAVYTDAALAAKGGDWRIIGVSLRSTDIADTLNDQDGVYTVIVRHPDGAKAQKIRSLSHVLAASRGIEPVLAALAAPTTRIVTITVTEKAYGIDRASGGIVADHPAITHDLQHPRQPSGLIGLLVEGLRRRRDAGEEPFTVLSCDNLPENGVLLRAGVIDFARRIDAALADWIARNAAFPSSMVDRITPAATAKTAADALTLTGHEDLAAVETEPFSQWVIEDHFPLGRPAWEIGGALLVGDVKPYEHMKLRMLNGSHSLIAYLGVLAGYRYVRDVMADPQFATLVRQHLASAAATLEPLSGIDFAVYGDDLVERFKNPEIAHETRQIAMDGTEKLPQRILIPVCEALRDGKPVGSFALAVAAWMAAMKMLSDQEGLAGISDPRAHDIFDAASTASDAGSLYDHLSCLPGLFPDELLASTIWQQAVTRRLHLILSSGARAAVLAETGSADQGIS
ncbi:MAG: mannitol dehydrogenase family protein [Pseudomonadota bacterium]